MQMGLGVRASACVIDNACDDTAARKTIAAGHCCARRARPYITLAAYLSAKLRAKRNDNARAHQLICDTAQAALLLLLLRRRRRMFSRRTFAACKRDRHKSVGRVVKLARQTNSFVLSSHLLSICVRVAHADLNKRKKCVAHRLGDQRENQQVARARISRALAQSAPTTLRYAADELWATRVSGTRAAAFTRRRLHRRRRRRYCRRISAARCAATAAAARASQAGGRRVWRASANSMRKLLLCAARK